MVTTFVHLRDNCTKKLWHFLAEATQADMRLVELEYPSLKKILNNCAGRVLIYVHPSFYNSLKLRYSLDVGGISRDGQVTTELGTGSLGRAVGILTPEDFRPVVSNE